MTKTEREEREYKSLFTDERYAKKAWKQFFNESLQSDAANMPEFYDAKGNVAPQSVIYKAAVENVRQRLRDKGLSREPMKAEVLVEANVIRSAFDTQVFGVVLDRTAGKVKEEISIGVGAYEELTDEELALLVAHRENKQLSGGEDDNT